MHPRLHVMSSASIFTWRSFVGKTFEGHPPQGGLEQAYDACTMRALSCEACIMSPEVGRSASCTTLPQVHAKSSINAADMKEYGARVPAHPFWRLVLGPHILKVLHVIRWLHTPTSVSNCISAGRIAAGLQVNFYFSVTVK